jgi:hypothetical protein
MPRIACPNCKHVQPFGEGQWGTVITCAGCARRLKLPAARPQPSSGPAREGEARRDPEAPPAPRRGKPAPAAEDEQPAPRKRKAAEDDPPAEAKDRSAGRKKKKRKEAPAAVGVLSGVGGLIVLVGFLLLITGKWVPLVWEPLQAFLESQGVHPLLAVGITAGIVMIPVGVFWVVTTKSSMLGAMPSELDFRPARAADFPDLDEEKLSKYTEAFESLGFRRVTDYTTATDLDNDLTGFARLFFHPKEGCYAEVNQVLRSSGAAAPMRCSLMSHLEDGWSVSTGDRQASRESYVMRRPRAAWQSLPKADPEELLEAHLNLRDRMARDLGVEVLEEGKAEDYYAHEREAAEQRKQAVRRRGGIGILVDRWLFDKKPKTEWLGGYTGKGGKGKKKS